MEIEFDKYHNSCSEWLRRYFEGETYCCALFDELTVLYNNQIT